MTRVSEISAVRTLRECRASLSVDELAWLESTLKVVEREAFGIQVTGLSRLAQGALVHRPDIDESDPVDRAARTIGTVALAAVGVFNIGRLVTKLFPPKTEPRSGEPLPAPENLVLAAEAWAIAAICEGRLDLDVSVLREPWEKARVDT